MMMGDRIADPGHGNHVEGIAKFVKQDLHGYAAR